MTLVFALLALLSFIAVAGRAHSRHLDRMEARWNNRSGAQ
jgi:hypothetical protein